MIKDHRGKVPNYIIQGGKMIHQPTGKFVLVGHKPSHRAMRVAQRQLNKQLSEVRK